DEISLIEPNDYVKLGVIISNPGLTDIEKNGSIAELLPYIRQKVKMWGVGVLRAENIKVLINKEVSKENITDDSESDSEDDFEDEELQRKNQLSRFDCIASLLSSAECIVVQDIFQTLSQFPITFPLITPKLNEEKEFNVMLPLYTGPIIKWEPSPGLIIENRLFSDPFKLIVAIRIGKNSTGKSTILNRLMTPDFMFSSKCDPRANFGVPYMVSGSVEFTWLTQETCKMDLWNEVFKDYYQKEKKEIVLLANLHGHALDYQDQIQFLNQLPSSFIVFIMPDYTKDQIHNLETLIDFKKNVYVCVDHKNKERDCIKINTKTLIEDHTLGKVRNMFKKALNVDSDSVSLNIDKLNLGTSLKMVEGIELSESQELINFIKTKTCHYTKLNIMQLQKINENCPYIWQDNDELIELVKLYTNILTLPLDKRRRALAHVGREVSRISMEESSESRNQAILKRIELSKSSLVNKDEEREMIQNEIRKLWAEVDNKSLGLEHFYRVLGQLYKVRISDLNDINFLKLPELYAELLIDGHTIELLNGDAGIIPEAWFSAICNHVCRRFNNLRVYVISIIGLQSSGKSTLLNALFGCRFAVSVGRCTKGLFMRLLFLEEDLCNQLGVDAIIVIDTEGLGAIEKMESEKNDRILVTFAMGISNLTIINVLGESMRDLTEMLQIAIVTMARLEKADIAPDIKMVQHISERNKAKLSEPEESFRTALQEALKITVEKDMEMGIFNAECLKILDKRIKDGKFLKQFRPFKNGATVHAPPSEQYHEDIVDLYNSILDDCKNLQRKFKFEEWHTIIQGYWSAVSHEDFAVRFKNIKEIYKFIEHGKITGKVKEAISEAFLKHEERIMQEIRAKLQEWSCDGKSKENSDFCSQLLQTAEEELKYIPSCDCEECKNANNKIIEFEKYLKGENDQKFYTDCKQTIDSYIELNRQSASSKLVHIIEANFIQKGYSSQFLNIINKALEDIRNKSNGKFSDDEITQKITEIWNLLRNNISSKYPVTSVEDKIYSEVKSVYSSWLSIVSVKNEYKNGIIPDLYEFGLILKIQVLQKQDIDIIEKRLDDLTDLILEGKPQHFYNGIVSDLKSKIEKTFTDYSTLKAFPMFKQKAHIYALLKFKLKLLEYQKKWDEENHPLCILDQKKEEYSNIIKARLQNESILVAEAYIVADYLLRVIHKKVMITGNRALENAVKKIPWLSSTETVRLKYFEELANEVQNGYKKNALNHFKNPKRHIKNWFKFTVESVVDENLENKYNDTFRKEISLVYNNICDCENYEEIKLFINNYMTNVDKIDYKFCIEDSIIRKNKDFETFRDIIIKEISAKKDNYYSNQGNKELFIKLSDDSSIMKKLGCIESCYWCGALCWGFLGHHENSDKSKIHYTNHQPRGLGGTKYRKTKEIVSTACHRTPEDIGVFYFGKEFPTKWSTAKAKDFSNWKFIPHHKKAFNDLMCWFFEKLHEDLANFYELEPASNDNLKHNGCLNLNYDDIISALRTEIYPNVAEFPYYRNFLHELIIDFKNKFKTFYEKGD
ncbi:41003_t:CDS:1, partial [Gigaspora margarita]